MSSKTIAKIETFKNLDQGWHYGEGDALSPIMINKAIYIHKLIEDAGYLITNAFPGVNCILVTGYSNDHDIEVFVEDGFYELLVESSDGTDLLNQFFIDRDELKELLPFDGYIKQV